MIASIDKLRDELANVPTVCPTVIDESLPEGDATLLREVGMPREFAGWFKTVGVVEEAASVRGACFRIGLRKHYIGRAFVIGRRATGIVVIDGKTGAVVFVDDEGQGELVNSSLPQFLLCVSQFEKCTENEYRDVTTRRQNCEAIDPAAFVHDNSPWSLLFFEAESGMF